MRITSVRTLTRLAESGAHGRHWYTYAESSVRSAAATIGCDPGRLADLLALFSPRVSVRRSIRMTLAYVTTGHHLPDVICYTRSAVAHYERTGQIRGPKTSAFAMALRGDPTAIVLDTWMARAFHVRQADLERRTVRTECMRRIRLTARRLEWSPAETQAAIWTAIATLPPGIKRTAGDRRYRTAPALDVTAELSFAAH